jgi:hypothetical protein
MIMAPSGDRVITVVSKVHLPHTESPIERDHRRALEERERSLKIETNAQEPSLRRRSDLRD